MLISVIVPVYNSSQYLRESLNSVVNQTVKNIEVILVNDGSTDESLKICEEFRELDSRVIILNQKNSGVCSARNHGFDISKGEYIIFVDSDDILELDLLETLLNLILEYKTDIAMCGVKMIYPNNRTIQPEENLEIEIFEKKEAIYKFLNKEFTNYGLWTKLFKKEILNNISFDVNKKIGEDKFYFFEALLNSNSIATQNINKYNYFKRINSATMRKFNLNNFDVLYFSKKIENIIEKLYPEYHRLSKTNMYIEYLNIFRRMNSNSKIIEEYPEQYQKIFLKIKKNRTYHKKYLSKRDKYESFLLSKSLHLYTKITRIYWRYRYGK